MIFGFFLKTRYRILSGNEHVLLDQLFFYHMIMSFIFFLYISFDGGDATNYWFFPRKYEFDQLWEILSSGKGSPSYYLYFLNYFPSKVLNLEFFTGCIIYGVLGYWGIIFMVVSLKENIPLLHHLKHFKVLNFPIYPGIFFLPNFHFWSAGVGKDTLLFFCVCAFIYVLNNVKKRWFIFIPIFLISYTIRPHILLFLAAGFFASFILKSRLLIFQKSIIIGIAFVAFLPLLDNVLAFAQMDEASVDSFTEFSETKSGHLSRRAGSGIDISGLPYPLQVLTFLYRPLFFDAPNVLGLMASVENVIWLTLTIVFLRNKPIHIFKNTSYIILGSFLFWIIGALAFAPSLSNLGIIIRQRNMFLPAFIIFAVAGLAYTNKFKKFEWFYYIKKMEWDKNKQNAIQDNSVIHEES